MSSSLMKQTPPLLHGFATVQKGLQNSAMHSQTGNSALCLAGLLNTRLKFKADISIQYIMRFENVLDTKFYTYIVFNKLYH